MRHQASPSEVLALDSLWRIASTEAVLWDAGRESERAPAGGRAIERAKARESWRMGERKEGRNRFWESWFCGVGGDP